MRIIETQRYQEKEANWWGNITGKSPTQQVAPAQQPIQFDREKATQLAQSASGALMLLSASLKRGASPFKALKSLLNDVDMLKKTILGDLA